MIIKKVFLLIVIFVSFFPFYQCGSSSHRQGEVSSGRRDVSNKLSMADDFKGSSGGSPQKKEKEQDIKGKQVTTWKRSQILSNTSRLMIGDKEELPLKGMQAKVEITGFKARVLIDCYFYNDRNRNFEGTFKLRLPDGASPYFFAFGESKYTLKDNLGKRLFYTLGKSRRMGMQAGQIMQDRKEDWIKPKEARMVPKERAARAYHDTVRRRIDPALMEWSGAGIFSARIFPLSAQKIHRVVIGYDVNLIKAGADFEYTFDVPKNNAEKMIDIIIADPIYKRAKVTILPRKKAIKVKSLRVYRFSQLQDKQIKVRIKNLKAALLIGKDKSTDSFFAANFSPELKASKNISLTNRAIFLLDTSLSSNPDKFNIWIKLLETILKSNQDSIKEFNVLFFNIENFWHRKKFVKNNPANIKRLINHLNQLALEGATDIGAALKEAVTPVWYKKGKSNWNIFLLSDGAITWGDKDHYMLSGLLKKKLKGSLYAYKTGLAGSDYNMLNQLAGESGGTVFSVMGEAEIARAARAHLLQAYKFISAKIHGGSDLIMAGLPEYIYPGQNLLLVGRWHLSGKFKKAYIVDIILENKKGTQINVKTRIDQTYKSSLAVRAYAQIAVSELENFTYLTEKYSKAYAAHFRITGKTCSLLMLESEADYTRYNIKPLEDINLIKQYPASNIIKGIVASIVKKLSDPRENFLAWFKKIEKKANVKFPLKKELLAYAGKIPVHYYKINKKQIICKNNTWTGLDSEIQNQLKTKKLDYDKLVEDGNRRLVKYGKEDALKAVSSLIENSPGDVVLIRDISYSAMKWGFSGHAFYLLKLLTEIRPYEPQTYHAMANILAEQGNDEVALLYYEICIQGNWDGRFGDFRQIAVMDYLRFLRGLEKRKKNVTRKYFYFFAKKRLQEISRQYNVKSADLIITIMWNTDNTDIDLHVVEPTGEECYYAHSQTRLGGKITRDVTTGYGPEMYILPKYVSGYENNASNYSRTFKIKVKYFSSNRSRASARTKIYAVIYKNYGKQNETIIKKVVTLKDNKEMHEIMEIDI